MLNKYFYNISVTIVGIITAIFILTTIGGLFYIPVNSFYVLIPFIGGIYYLRKQSPENIDFLKQFLILLLIIMFSYIISVYVWDSSSDGRWYHSATLVMLKNGWLPIYHNYQEFAKICHVYPACAFFGTCYLHFTEIIGANIYKMTGFIESAKTVNFIMLSVVFMYSYSVLREFKPENKIIPLITSVIIILNPVCICQWFTNFVDLHIYFSFALLVLTLIKIEFYKISTKTDLFMAVCSSLILAMTKLTGCAYLFIISFIYFIYLILLKRNIKRYIKIILMVAVLIAVTGVNPFYTNLADYGHSFYPLFGKNKINIMDENLPLDFKNKSNAERFIRSNFSDSVQSQGNVSSYIYPVEIKIPFTIHIKSPAYSFYYPDIRVGGFGYLWSGILLLSLIYLPFIRFRNKNEKNIFWLVITMILISTFLNAHSWWTRLVPQFWLFPIFIMFFGLLQDNYKNKKSKISKLSLLYIVLLSFIFNSLIVLFQNTEFSLKLTNLLKKPYEYIKFNKNSKDKILLIVRPDLENKIMADETIIPHLEEYFGKESIIYVPYEENKIIMKEYIPIQYIYVLNNPCYFFKIEKKP